MKVCAVIMAGGKGERFWPKSRKNKPKQFLSLFEKEKTMIQQTVERINGLVDLNDIFIVTNYEYSCLIKEQLPNINEENILYESASKNTAPCVAYAAATVTAKYDEDVIMVVLPSDHIIKFNNMFIDTVKQAINVADNTNSILTIGIIPTYPETGYGYIKYSKKYDEKFQFCYKVDEFVEKPNEEVAKDYIESECYLWNSGMFIWKASTIIDSLKKYCPNLYTAYSSIKEAVMLNDKNKISNIYKSIAAISIDYAVMEKADNVFTIPGNFGWDDAGTWNSIKRLGVSDSSGNVIQGNVISIATNDTIVIGNKKLIATVGLNNMIIVDTDDSILIASQNNAQEIKKITENLKTLNLDDLL